MDIQQKGIIKLVQSALTQTKQELPEGFVFDDAVKIVKKHQITSIVYYGAMHCGIPQDNALMQELFNFACKAILVSEQQMHSLNKIFDVFDERKIEYMPLKGTLLKKMYPKPEMRLMGDADILIKTEQYDIIKEIMQELGYSESVESDHEYAWKKQNVYIELHKRLIPSYNKDYYEYYGDGWRLAKNNCGNCYAMTDEDQMIYLFTHFAKHYRCGGIGIRHLVDLYVYRKNKSVLDESYIKQELKKLNLYEFYQNVIDTLDVWFENKESNEKTELITQFIFNSGVYGTHEAKKLSDTYKKSKSGISVNKTRIGSFLKTAFLPYSFMAEKYAILKRVPILLPIMWRVRACKVVLFKRGKVKTQIKDFETTTSKRVNDYGSALKFVGLDFNFEE